MTDCCFSSLYIATAQAPPSTFSPSGLFISRLLLLTVSSSLLFDRLAMHALDGEEAKSPCYYSFGVMMTVMSKYPDVKLLPFSIHQRAR